MTSPPSQPQDSPERGRQRQSREQRNQSRRIRYWSNKNSGLVQNDAAYNPGNVAFYKQTFGPEATEKLLKQQAAATRAWQRGDTGPGRELWHMSAEELGLTGEEADYWHMTDPLRYYHTEAWFHGHRP